MFPPQVSGKTTRGKLALITLAGLVVLCLTGLLVLYFWPAKPLPILNKVETLTGAKGESGEPFGIAFCGDQACIADGEAGMVRSLDVQGATASEERGLDTPSGLAVTKDGPVVVDSGRNAIYRLDPSPTLIAGIEGKRGFADGDALSAQFNGPIGIAIDEKQKLYIADTYNDRIRVIENGKVSTLAGSTRGYADGVGSDARFDTPTGLAMWGDRLLVADTGNARIRVVEPDGRVWTLAGSAERGWKDGRPLAASFSQPTALAVSPDGAIYVGDGNSLRRIGGSVIPMVTTLNDPTRGAIDGPLRKARFNRISGLAFTDDGDLLVADSENGLVRRVSAAVDTPLQTTQIGLRRNTAEEFRNAAPGRWPYDPPSITRDIAGTLGEVRGEVTPGDENVWFHNGLDIAGAYGEVARFIREEKVLRPVAAENFETLRELVRMPTLGYIHIRLGRDQFGKPFDDARFQFDRDQSGKLAGVRIPRGARFMPGDAIGTLNAMNHVHLIAGPSGAEMNALAALDLPGVADDRPPVIESVELFDRDWRPLETKATEKRIKLAAETRIVLRAYDQMNGNPERRRLGVYKLGYQLLGAGGQPVVEPSWGISFDRMPANEAVKFAYAENSRSGATGETRFKYIVTNFVQGDDFREGFLESSQLPVGEYTLRVFAADFFGNTTTKDIAIEITR